MKKIYFAPYQYTLVDEMGEIHKSLLIAMYINNMIVRITDYSRYVSKRKGSKYLYATDNDGIRRVCNFLNFVLTENRRVFKVTCIANIPFIAAEMYINNFSKTKRNGRYPSKQSVVKERDAVSHFMYNLGKQRYDREEHYYVKPLLIKGGDKELIIKGKTNIQWEYEIEAKYLSNDNRYNLIRDIPQKAIPLILKTIKREAPDLYLAVLLQLTAGLRAGEVVNIRRPDSKYPGGIKFRTVNGEFQNFEVDLTKNYLLRSDGNEVGYIKVKRMQSVYPIFLKEIQRAYEEHLEIINSIELEEDKPLFVTVYTNKKIGKRIGLTKKAYCKRIKQVMKKYVVPELLKSKESELITYGLLVNENSWGVHAFRHWFTVQLVLNDEDINSIASWRGDRSLQSSFTYLQNKGEIMKKYRKANENVAQWTISQILGEDFYESFKETR
ncbi:hypothetical protein QTL86_02000 [Cellulosilyticum sp. ST5]|uniref:hypothetical protein n=1 Tax=Cellulosilyticum sp. ST5 TaxID=3055805 RepID=UPI003977AFF8